MKKLLISMFAVMFLLVSVSAAAIDFSTYNAGDSIEDVLLGGYITINSTNDDTIVVNEGDTNHLAYNANPNTQNNIYPNGCLPATEGFSDSSSTGVSNYTFTFEQPMSEFSMVMYDYGDWNYWNKQYHEVTLTAYDSDDNIVDVSVLNFTSDTATTSGTSPQYGFMGDFGDACEAPIDFSKPGRWMFSVSGDDIAYAKLDFVYGADPAVAFGLFEYEFDEPEESGTGDFRTIGFWKHQFSGKGKAHYNDTYLQSLLDMLPGPYNGLDGAGAQNALWLKGKGISMEDRAYQQCLATMLNYANGAVVDTDEVDTDYDGVVDTLFSDVMDDVLADDEDYESDKNICDSINNMNH